MTAQEASWSHNRCHLKAQSTILDVEGFEAIVRSYVKAVIVFDLERRVNRKERVDRIWFCRGWHVEFLADGNDAEKEW